jgi:hypothetical protein
MAVLACQIAIEIAEDEVPFAGLVQLRGLREHRAMVEVELQRALDEVGRVDKAGLADRRMRSQPAAEGEVTRRACVYAAV